MHNGLQSAHGDVVAAAISPRCRRWSCPWAYSWQWRLWRQLHFELSYQLGLPILRLGLTVVNCSILQFSLNYATRSQDPRFPASSLAQGSRASRTWQKFTVLFQLRCTVSAGCRSACPWLGGRAGPRTVVALAKAINCHTVAAAAGACARARFAGRHAHAHGPC